jgi:aspartate kinase
MGVKVAKFGGSSVADAAQLRKVESIVNGDPDRQVVVVSAPGKRSPDDSKITDLLYRCHDCVARGVSFGDVFSTIAERYKGIVRALGLSFDFEHELELIRSGIEAARTPDFAASRGEYLSARIVAELLQSDFVDAIDIVQFNEEGRLSVDGTGSNIRQRLQGGKRVVVPGFYGSAPDGSIRTFSRGGSDITGAILARGIQAEVYENWTDVSGVLMTDPRIVPDAEPIEILTYRELRELAYMGASVLHEEAIFPVIDAGIPVNVRNTNAPADAGTWIVSRVEETTNTITGIAGRKGYTVIGLERSMMNTEVGFGRKLLSALERHGVSFEHMPTGIDTVSLVVDAVYLKGKLESVLNEIRRECRPERIEVYENMALIATVGRGMMHMPGVASRLFGALGAENINVRMIDQGSSELNIIVGVEDADFEKAIRAIYRAFVA